MNPHHKHRIKTRNHTTYTWDDRGYLINPVKPGTTIDYAYNALGARVSKTVNGVTTKYLTAPVFGMNHVLMELDGNNSVTARHVYGGHEQLAEELSGSSQYLPPGGSTGNITHALNSSAAVINEYSYDAFGSRTLVSGSNTTRNGYTGEEYDAETGLLYLRARYYDPLLGRFISVDPFLGRMAEPATQNRYVYVMNNPVLYTDPSGLAADDDVSPYLVQSLFPANTAYLSKQPILGSPESQVLYAGNVNLTREIAAEGGWANVKYGLPKFIGVPLMMAVDGGVEYIAGNSSTYTKLEKAYKDNGLSLPDSEWVSTKSLIDSPQPISTKITLDSGMVCRY